MYSCHTIIINLSIWKQSLELSIHVWKLKSVRTPWSVQDFFLSVWQIGMSVIFFYISQVSDKLECLLCCKIRIMSGVLTLLSQLEVFCLAALVNLKCRMTWPIYHLFRICEYCSTSHIAYTHCTINSSVVPFTYKLSRRHNSKIDLEIHYSPVIIVAMFTLKNWKH